MKRRIFKVLVFVLLIIGAMLWYHSITTPFKTDEQKQIRPLYRAGTKGINIFKLMSVDINEDEFTKNKSIELYMKIKKNDVYGEFSNKELKTLNKFTNQMIDFLNNATDVNDIDDIYVRLYVGNGRNPYYVKLNIVQTKGQFSIDGCIIKCSTTVFDMYAIPDIKYIETVYGRYESIDDEDIEKLKSFSELKKIYFPDYSEKKNLIVLKEKLQGIHPNCKIYWGDTEIVLNNK